MTKSNRRQRKVNSLKIYIKKYVTVVTVLAYLIGVFTPVISGLAESYIKMILSPRPQFEIICVNEFFDQRATIKNAGNLDAKDIQISSTINQLYKNSSCHFILSDLEKTLFNLSSDWYSCHSNIPQLPSLNCLENFNIIESWPLNREVTISCSISPMKLEVKISGSNFDTIFKECNFL